MGLCRWNDANNLSTNNTSTIILFGYKKSHGFKFQAVMTPDGIISSLAGPWFGKVGDWRMYTDSGLEDHLRQINQEAEVDERCYLYGDPAYISKKKSHTPGCTPCSLCVRRSRRIERKLAFWVCGLLLSACGQGSMPPRRTRRNQGLRRYPTQKGSPDATR